MTHRYISYCTVVLLLAGCSLQQNKSDISLSIINTHSPRTLAMFEEGNQACYDRGTQPYTMVVDAHNHFRPFGGNAIPLYELDTYFLRMGVLFVNAFGIGQTLPIDSGCEYYLDCPNVSVIPSIKNDFHNATNYLEYTPKDLHITLSMSFPDLAHPDDIAPKILMLDEEFSTLFSWMGEVNLVKQALFQNGHRAPSRNSIKDWRGFMKLLRQRNMPISIHSDLGNNEEQEKYLGLMQEVLTLYPENKIVWVHLGLSKELTNLEPARHIAILSDFLRRFPNLMFDLSWRVIYDNYFSDPASRDLYVDFINSYSTRFLTGTDFVALHTKNFRAYAQEVEINSRIHLYLNDEAFRNIALGENYFRFMNLENYRAPKICSET